MTKLNNSVSKSETESAVSQQFFINFCLKIDKILENFFQKVSLLSQKVEKGILDENPHETRNPHGSRHSQRDQ